MSGVLWRELLPLQSWEHWRADNKHQSTIPTPHNDNSDLPRSSAHKHTSATATLTTTNDLERLDSVQHKYPPHHMASHYQRSYKPRLRFEAFL